MQKTKWFLIICILISLYFCLFSFQKIDLITADVGRHIKNGEIFLHSAEFGISKSTLLHTNLFSYTNPDFPFINHHWGSGVIMYLLWSLAGFKGLSVIYVLLIIASLIFVLLTVRKDVDLPSLFLVSFFLVPLISDRMEVRPEGVSYLFTTVFIYLLYNFLKGRISYKILFLIPFFEILWANMHIYFIFGPFLVGVFLLESLFRKNFVGAKKLLIILGLTSFATLLTPYGLSGAIYPFTIFNNYGYIVVENQSIPFLEKLFFVTPSFLWHKITSFLILISSIVVLLKTRKEFPLSLFIISVTFGILAFLGIRHMTAFGLVSLPLLAYNFSFLRKSFIENRKNLFTIIYCLFFVCILWGTFSHFKDKMPWKRNFGLGLTENSLKSGMFIKNNGIHGPIFNNYNIGGAMIFSLFPQEKVFVDNRPEAYPKNFFNDIYVPMQQDNNVWLRIDEKIHFNTIYFQWQDLTPWTQNFLIARVDDPQWAPVYVDNDAIVFLKRNDANAEIIKKYELPKSLFSKTQVQ